MLLEITFKTPDAVDDAIGAAVKRVFGDPDEADRDKAEDLAEANKTEAEKIKKVVDKFVRWGEYVTIEIDTMAVTARVLPSGTVR